MLPCCSKIKMTKETVSDITVKYKAISCWTVQ